MTYAEVESMPELSRGDKVLVLRNKFKGHIFRVHQAANDWVMVDAPKRLAWRESILLDRRDVTKVKRER